MIDFLCAHQHALAQSSFVLGILLIAVVGGKGIGEVIR